MRRRDWKKQRERKKDGPKETHEIQFKGKWKDLLKNHSVKK